MSSAGAKNVELPKKGKSDKYTLVTDKNTSGEQPNYYQMQQDPNDSEDPSQPLNITEPPKLSLRELRKRIRDNWKELRHLSPTMAFVLLFIPNYLYVSCNKTCPYKTAAECAVFYIKDESDIWAIKISLAATIFMFTSIISLYYKILHRLVGWFSLGNCIYLLFFYDNKINDKSYGGAFAGQLGIWLVCCIVIFCITQSFLFCCRKSRKATTLITLLSLGLISIVVYFKYVRGACARWEYGLGGEKIDNTIGCKVNTPDICTLDILDGWINMVHWQYDTCADAPSQTLLLEKNYSATTKYIGLSNCIDVPYKNWVFLQFQDYVLQDAISLESLDDPRAKEREFIVDNSVEGNATLHINIRRNETLVKERAAKNATEGLAKNVLSIFIDTMSRPRMFKKFPKTMEWVEKHYNRKSPKWESFQFFKYHSITPFTLNNMWAYYAGTNPLLPFPDTPPPEDPPITFAQAYKDNGYILGRSSDFCLTSALEFAAENQRYAKDVRFDHEGEAIACDPHYAIDKFYHLTTGPYSIMKRCAYGKDMFQHVFDYGEAFWRTYPTEKKLLVLEFIVAHEPTQEVIKEMDDPLLAFINRLDKDKLLEDTVILLWADHGDHIPMFPYTINLNTLNTERALPMLFLLLPTNMAEKYRDGVIGNKHRFVSAFQIHELMLSIPLGANSPHIEKSLMGKLPDLTCEDIVIRRQECYCKY